MIIKFNILYWDWSNFTIYVIICVLLKGEFKNQAGGYMITVFLFLILKWILWDSMGSTKAVWLYFCILFDLQYIFHYPQLLQANVSHFKECGCDAFKSHITVHRDEHPCGFRFHSEEGLKQHIAMQTEWVPQYMLFTCYS